MKDPLLRTPGATIIGLVVLVLALLYISEAAQAAPFCNNYDDVSLWRTTD